MNYRATRRLTAVLIVALLATGATKCQHGTDASSGTDNGSSGEQQAQQDTPDSSVTKAEKTCSAFRAAFQDMQPTAEERKLTGDARLKSSYKALQKFYAAFAQIFPESAPAANALRTVYTHAHANTLTTAEEAKIGGYDDKINKVIDKHCPNSGYPAS